MSETAKDYRKKDGIRISFRNTNAILFSISYANQELKIE